MKENIENDEYIRVICQDKVIVKIYAEDTIFNTQNSYDVMEIVRGKGNREVLVCLDKVIIATVAERYL